MKNSDGNVVGWVTNDQDDTYSIQPEGNDEAYFSLSGNTLIDNSVGGIGTVYLASVSLPGVLSAEEPPAQYNQGPLQCTIDPTDNSFNCASLQNAPGAAFFYSDCGYSGDAPSDLYYGTPQESTDSSCTQYYLYAAFTADFNNPNADRVYPPNQYYLDVDGPDIDYGDISYSSVDGKYVFFFTDPGSIPVLFEIIDGVLFDTHSNGFVYYDPTGKFLTSDETQGGGYVYCTYVTDGDYITCGEYEDGPTDFYTGCESGVPDYLYLVK